MAKQHQKATRPESAEAGVSRLTGGTPTAGELFVAAVAAHRMYLHAIDLGPAQAETCGNVLAIAVDQFVKAVAVAIHARQAP